jgi:DNA-binding NtrC family response regulator
MHNRIKALLVQANSAPLDALRLALEELSLEVSTATTCAEAALALWSGSPPHIAFTEIRLADGSWADILTLAAKAAAPVNVILVAPFADIRFYIDAIERGAFDYVVPPLSRPELLHVVRTATENSVRRRRDRKVTAPSLIVAQAAAFAPEHVVAGEED